MTKYKNKTLVQIYELCTRGIKS